MPQQEEMVRLAARVVELHEELIESKKFIEFSPEETKLATSTSIPDRITFYAKKYGVDEGLSRTIIKCEGGMNDLHIKNPKSGAEGPWQFILSTWKSTMVHMGYPAETSTYEGDLILEAGFYLLSKDGTRHWLESEFCWK